MLRSGLSLLVVLALAVLVVFLRSRRAARDERVDPREGTRPAQRAGRARCARLSSEADVALRGKERVVTQRLRASVLTLVSAHLVATSPAAWQRCASPAGTFFPSRSAAGK